MKYKVIIGLSKKSLFLLVYLLQNVSGLFISVCDLFPNHISGTICKYSMQLHRLRHETSQVAATQCEVCGGSVETLTHVVVLLEDGHIMKRHYRYDIM